MHADPPAQGVKIARRNTCEGPGGEKGVWTRSADKEVMDPDFDPLMLTPEERKKYSYSGPEAIYTFWAKHGPCQVTGCGHRTPIMSSNVMAVKTLTVKRWAHACQACSKPFDIESEQARMAPDAPLVLAPGERVFAMPDRAGRVTCPHCGHAEQVKLVGKGERKKIELSLLVHPSWLAGAPKADASGLLYGGSAQDDVEGTVLWNTVRAATIQLLEVRGPLPENIICPETGDVIPTGKAGGTVPRRSAYACSACGTVQDILTTVKASGKTGPMAGYAEQGFSPNLCQGKLRLQWTVLHGIRCSFRKTL